MILALGPTRPMPSAAPDDGSVIAFYIFAAVTIWLFLQLRTARREVWLRRANAVAPLIIYIASDIGAVYRMVANWVEGRLAAKKFRDQLGKDEQWPWS
jgi:hypothetical protein